jgi:hypothetical protein
MKKFTFTFYFMLLSLAYSWAQQGVAINTDNSNPDASAILDVKSTDKGILIPRMTEAEKNAIPVPALSLLIYQTDGTTGFYYYDGATWQPISSGSNGWGLTGNAGTTSGTNFIGTTDAQDLDFRTNNVLKARLTQKGQIEILNTGNSVFIGENTGLNDDLSDNRNVAIGGGAMQSNTTGHRNAALGYQAMYSNTTGQWNTGIGTYSLYNNTTGQLNSGSGYRTLENNTAGSYNTASGAYALFNNTTGTYNTSSGYYTLYANTTGNRNTAYGTSALQSNTIGNDNTSMGVQSLVANTTGNRNTAYGTSALQSNTTGNDNTSMGYLSLLLNQTGESNTALGIYAMYYNTGGWYNNAIGRAALQNNTTGSRNVANGVGAMLNNTTGNYNNVMGNDALYSNTTGSSNVAIGYRAGFSSTGSGNVFLGNDAGYSETGSNRLYIDNTTTTAPLIYGQFDNNYLRVNGTLNVNNAYSFPTTDGGNGQVLMTNGSGTAYWGTAAGGSGAWQTVTTNTEYRLPTTRNAYIRYGQTDLSGNNFNLGDGLFWGSDAGEDTGMFTDGDQILFISPGDNQLVQFWEEDGHLQVAQISGAGAYTQVSDRNLKQNIERIENGLDMIMNLNGYTYEFIQNEEDIKKGTPVELGMGVIAQELAEVAPRLATKSEQGHYLVNYDGIVPILIEATKEQQETINALKAEIAEIKALLNQQKDK